MSLDNFIPELWSASILENFHNDAVLVGMANRQYESAFTAGSKIHIPGIVDVKIKDYKTGAVERTGGGGKIPRTTVPDAVESTGIEMTIDQEKSFDFLVDDIDRAQVNQSLDAYTKSAATGLVEDAETFLTALLTSKGTAASGITNPTDWASAYTAILKLRGKLSAAKVPASSAAPAAPTTTRRRYQGPRTLARVFLTVSETEPATPMVAAFWTSGETQDPPSLVSAVLLPATAARATLAEASVAVWLPRSSLSWLPFSASDALSTADSLAESAAIPCVTNSAASSPTAPCERIWVPSSVLSRVGRLSVATSCREVWALSSPLEETCLVMGVLSVCFPAQPGLAQTLGTCSVPEAGQTCGPPMSSVQQSSTVQRRITGPGGCPYVVCQAAAGSFVAGWGS